MDADARDRLILEHRSLVWTIARSMRKTFHPYYDFDDLAGWGMLGLVDAADRFIPTGGCSFSTYAKFRIRGTIYDGIRQGLPRNPAARKSFRQINGASLEINQEREIARRWARETDAYRQMYRKEMREWLELNIRHLSSREQTMLKLYYVEELPMREIGRLMGVNESRICQIHGRTIRNLRRRMDRYAVT